MAARIIRIQGLGGLLDFVTRNVRLLWGALGQRLFGWSLWPAIVGVAWCLWGGLRSRTERRFCALSALGFTAVAIVTFGRWDRYRYPLAVAVPAMLCAAALTDDLFVLAARRWPRARLAFALAPALLLGPLVLAERPPLLLSLEPWFLENRQKSWPAPTDDEWALSRLCRAIPRGALVASPDPWSVHLWCGNPTIMTPRDFDEPAIREGFFSLRGAKYVVTNGWPPHSWREGAIRLQGMAGAEPYVLHRVLGAPGPPQDWSLPTPLVCAGMPPRCVRQLRGKD
jgi:hypothetical protein